MFKNFRTYSKANNYKAIDSKINHILIDNKVVHSDHNYCQLINNSSAKKLRKTIIETNNKNNKEFVFGNFN